MALELGNLVLIDLGNLVLDLGITRCGKRRVSEGRKKRICMLCRAILYLTARGKIALHFVVPGGGNICNI